MSRNRRERPERKAGRAPERSVLDVREHRSTAPTPRSRRAADFWTPLERARPLVRALVGVAVLLASCTVITEFSPDKYLEQSEARCSDHVDNDGNGKIDCADTTCRQFDFCKETTEDSCSDNQDNDQDGTIDCKDPKCCHFSHCAAEPSCGESSSTACADGIDNDNNGLTDCADFGCTIKSCCTRPLPLLAETFDATSASCQVIDCQDQQEQCCAGKNTWCNAFDNQRWVAWGEPRPRIIKGAFAPNQPCPGCPASGLLSLAETDLAPDLHLEFEADLKNDTTAELSVGLVQQITVPNAGSCGGVSAPFPLLLGIAVSGTQVQAQVGGSVQATTAGVPTGRQRLWITVGSDGSIGFGLGESEFYRSTVKVAAPYSAVRVLIQGRSTGARIDNVLLARSRACLDLGAWSAGPTGPGPVLAPGTPASRFDAASVSSPSVFFDGEAYRLYYTGRCTSKDECTVQGSGIGVALSTDGQIWRAPDTALTIHGEAAAQVSDPAVSYSDGVYLMAYRTVSLTGTPSIAVATSDNGLSWTRQSTAVQRGGAQDWDGGDVRSPALARFRNRYYLWYAGLPTTSTVPSIGLAIASDTSKAFTKQKDSPVLTPEEPLHEERGVDDPAVYLEGDTLRMWYVGLGWGNRSTINAAVSEDGRNWVRYPKNPLISAGDAGLFGGSSVRGPSVLDRWGKLLMWYGGHDPNGLPSIGQAVNTSK